MKLSTYALLGASLVAMAAPAHASLIGMTVNGSINFGGGGINYYDPANGFVPGGYGNTGGLPVVIGAGTEFGFQDGANRDTADFTGTQLIINDVVFSNATNWTQRFSLVGPNQFNSLSLAFDGFTPGLTWSLNAGVIEINWAGTNAPNDFRAVFNVGAGGAVPEPATWAMLILGFGMVGGVMRSARRSTRLAYA